jgi:hypothetical protein
MASMQWRLAQFVSNPAAITRTCSTNGHPNLGAELEQSPSGLCKSFHGEDVPHHHWCTFQVVGCPHHALHHFCADNRITFATSESCERQWSILCQWTVQVLHVRQQHCPCYCPVPSCKQWPKRTSGTIVQEKLSKFLFTYRHTPQTTTGVAPAQLLMNRCPRSRLNRLFPDLSERVATPCKASRTIWYIQTHSEPSLLVTLVYVKDFFIPSPIAGADPVGGSGPPRFFLYFHYKLPQVSGWTPPPPLKFLKYCHI